MKSRRSAWISASVASISAAVDFTAPAPSVAPSINAQSLWTAPSFAPNGAFALAKSAVTKIQLLEPAALGVQTTATDVNPSANSIRLSLPIIFSPQPGIACAMRLYS
jgi:hypothetical protein